MPEARDGIRELVEVALSRFAIDPHDPVWLGKRDAAQKERMDQAENRGVQADAERKGEDREEREARRLAQLPEREAEISHHMKLWMRGVLKKSPVEKTPPLAAFV